MVTGFTNFYDYVGTELLSQRSGGVSTPAQVLFPADVFLTSFKQLLPSSNIVVWWCGFKLSYGKISSEVPYFFSPLVAFRKPMRS